MANVPRQAEVRALTDANIVRVAQQGDIVVFERTYRLHIQKVRKLRLRIVGAPARAEEVTDLQVEASLSGLASETWAR